MTKVGVKKDMNKHRSENSLYNALSYAIAVVSTYFIIGEELEDWTCKKWSDDVKNTIELVKRLNNAEKFRSITPDQIIGSDDTSLFMYTCSTNDKKRTCK